jgi:hypothetical protein
MTTSAGWVDTGRFATAPAARHHAVRSRYFFDGNLRTMRMPVR